MLFVNIWINFKKILWFYVSQYCMYFIQRIQVCDTNFGRLKKLAENSSDPKKLRKFCEPHQKITLKLANTG